MPENNHYQVLSRRYRPQLFADVIGQEGVVATLKNAVKQKRIAHAYLFSGPRGTGKTTLARLFAKALNCIQLSDEGEPCNGCASCKEIAACTSMDVLEIDGASNRGIDDVRKINDNVSYASSSGKYKVYIIDEVHMLTKEAFNALLKTLEEPPQNVLFVFATTEPHKMLPTILSRCQRFNLKRLPAQQIQDKLKKIAQDLNRSVEPDVFKMVADRAEGGLRDAESLFDQILAFEEGPLTQNRAAELLGIVPEELFFQFDQAGAEGKLSFAFDLSAQLFDEGKDLAHFLQGLTEHFRLLLIAKLAAGPTALIEGDAERIRSAASLYRKEQLLSILDLCIDAESTLKSAPSLKIALEGLLLRIMRTHQLIPIDLLVKRLVELEAKVGSPAAQPKAPPPVIKSITEDPTPELKELPKHVKPKVETPPSPPAAPAQTLEKKTQSRYDTLMQFAAVELEGKLTKK